MDLPYSWNIRLRKIVYPKDGNEVPPGHEFTDKTHSYLVKKDLILISRVIPASDGMDKVDVKYYYRIKKSSDDKGYQLLPIPESEFK